MVHYDKQLGQMAKNRVRTPNIAAVIRASKYLTNYVYIYLRYIT